MSLVRLSFLKPFITFFFYIFAAFFLHVQATSMATTTHLRTLPIDPKMGKHFSTLPELPLSNYLYSGMGTALHFVQSGDPSLPVVLLIHGAPGDWTALSGLMTNQALIQKFQFLAVDRPGYGLSDKGLPDLSLKSQATKIHQAVSPFIQDKKVFIIGHSFGGPVAIQLLVDQPELFSGALVLAGSVSPEAEVVTWYQRLAHQAFIRGLLPKPLMVANEEILPLKSELTKLLPFWASIKTPVTVIHGTKDRLVPYENAIFMKERLSPDKFKLITLTNVNHFIPWTHQEVVVQALLKLSEPSK